MGICAHASSYIGLLPVCFSKCTRSFTTHGHPEHQDPQCSSSPKVAHKVRTSPLTPPSSPNDPTESPWVKASPSTGAGT